MKIKIAIISLLFIPALVFAQDGAALPNAGITPESPFYFLDRLGETFQDLFTTFNVQAKARLQVAFIAERTSEVRVMLEREVINKGAVEIAFGRMAAHRTKLGEIIPRVTIEEREVFSASIVASIDPLEDVLGTILEEAKIKLEREIEAEEQRIEQKLNEPAFVAEMERVLREVAAVIDQEIGRPLEEFLLIEDEYNVDVDDDTYSATYRAEVVQLVDFAAIKNRMLERDVARGWKSGDVSLVDDSLDITFEKTFPAVIIEEITLFPEASVTVSATHFSRRGYDMTEMNYDIDITLESESENLSDFLDKQEDLADEKSDAFFDELEERMDVQKSSERSIREAEKGKQELLNDVVAEGIVVPAGIFSEFDGLLAQAKTAFAAENFQEAKRFAEQAEEVLNNTEATIEDLLIAKEKEEKLKEKQEEINQAREAIEEAQRSLEQAPIEMRVELEQRAEEARREYQEKLKEVEEKRKELERAKKEMMQPTRPIRQEIQGGVGNEY